MLFIAMIAAAAFAAPSATGAILGANSPTSASMTFELRDASAATTNVPARCCSVSAGSAARLDKLSLRSFAYSGKAFFSFSRDIAALPSDESGAGSLPAPGPRSCGLENVFALLPVAGAQLVHLQSVQDTQHFLRVSADIEVVHRNEADDPLGIDDERRAQTHALALVEDAESGAQLSLDVRQHGKRQVPEIRVGLPPCEMNELAVRRYPVHDRVAVGELVVELAESGDLGRAYEREILRPEEHDLPLPFVGPIRNLRERPLRIGRYDSPQIETRKPVTNGQHLHSPHHRDVPVPVI